jgi:hypothetical protein
MKMHPARLTIQPSLLELPLLLSKLLLLNLRTTIQMMMLQLQFQLLLPRPRSQPRGRARLIHHLFNYLLPVLQPRKLSRTRRMRNHQRKSPERVLMLLLLRRTRRRRRVKFRWFFLVVLWRVGSGNWSDNCMLGAEFFCFVMHYNEFEYLIEL